MPAEPNRLLRVVVPLVMVIAGIGIAAAVFRNTGGAAQNQGAVSGQGPAAPGQTPPPAGTPVATPGPDSTSAPSAQPAPTTPPSPAAVPPASSAASTTPPAPAPVLAAPIVDLGALEAKLFDYSGYAPVGSTTPKDKGGTFEMELRFGALGTGLSSLKLANHFTTIRKTEPDTIQEFVALPGSADPRIGLAAFGANKVEINGQTVELALSPQANKTFWREISPGQFEAEIQTKAGEPVASIRRVFEIKPGAYEFVLKQTISNTGAKALNVKWYQYGPMDQPLGLIRYGGDVRRVRFGYLLPKSLDTRPTRESFGDRFLLSHQEVLGKQDSGEGTFARWSPKALWPNPTSIGDKFDLSWVATTSRYFSVGVHPYKPGGPSATGVDPTLSGIVESVDRLAIPADPSNVNRYPSGRGPQGYMVTRLVSPSLTIAPGAQQELSFGVYAGPSSKRYIQSQPMSMWTGLSGLVVYTFGGPCAFCTFQPVAGFLRSFLGFLHDHVVFDWALAVMLLVVCVRTLLHPVTRWSQMKLFRFQKQMGKFGPKLKILQEKYKDDQAKLREEMSRLYKEEGVSFSGGLGCIPMFLQMPIWIALYAMIYFTFELRHEHAFFGIFQSLSGHKWSFLGDLAEPDNFMNFHEVLGWASEGFWVWGLSTLMGPIQALNIIPLLLGVVFWFQQKYMTPPQSVPMTPEQEMQMKMMKVMMVVMFPLFMYNAPAALSLYFMVNSILGILESKWIRARAEKVEAAREAKEEADRVAGIYKKKSQEPKKEGFFARLQRLAAEAEKQRQKNTRPKGKK